MTIRSILKPEGSVMAALGVAGSVYAIYNLSIGSASGAQATTANHPALESSRKKAGYYAFILVSGLAAITRDGNVVIVGYGSIAAMEIFYRHSIMASPETGQLVSPSPTAWQNVENVVPLNQQAPTAVSY